MSSSNSAEDRCSRIKYLCSEAFQFESASLMHPLLLIIISCIAVFGSVCQIIGLNFWLHIDSRGPFTTAAVVAIFWDIILFIILALWAIKLAMKNGINRFDFLWDAGVMAQLFIIGCLEGAGTLSVSYSALGTMESLQSMIKATVVPATAIFTIFVLKFDPGVTTKVGQLKALCRWESVSAVVLILAAVAMIAFGGKSENDSDHDHQYNNGTNSTTDHNSSSYSPTNTSINNSGKEKDSSWLPWICFLGALFNALHFVLQGHFMDTHTLEHRSFFNDENSLFNYTSYVEDEDNENINNNNNDTIVNSESRHQITSSDPAQQVSGEANSNAMMVTYGSGGGGGGLGAADHTASSIPIIESSLQNRLSVDIVGARDNKVAGALLHHHSSAVSNYSDGINNDIMEDDNSSNSRHQILMNERGVSSSSKKNNHRRRSPFAVRSDDFTVKISMLAVDTFFQIIFTFMCLPLDIIPGFGSHETISEAWTAFSVDFRGIFSNEPHMSTNYFMLFLFGWCSSHLAFAYLNHYSPTFTPMVMILASPITNIILLIAPSWNAHPEGPVVWSSVVSAFLMIGAAILFGRFEVGRKKRRIESMQRF